MKISVERLMGEIDRYGLYGQNSNGGVTRPSFSEADYKIREIFIQDLKALDLEVIIDGAANIWGRLKGTGQKKGSLVIGSHLDTVPNGGKYDGALGVLMAKELIQVIKEEGIKFEHDIEIVSFTAEEANDFNVSTMGSRSLTGKLDAGYLANIVDSTGVLLSEALEKVGGSLSQYSNMKAIMADKKVFIELHIEQGKRLEEKNIPVGVVDKIVGIYRDKVTVYGEANHSGTTMMNHRFDALTTASELMLAVEKICKDHPSDAVGTVGKLNIYPNATNIIPGKVDFILEIRGETEDQIADIIKDIKNVWEKITGKRNIKITVDNILNQKPVLLDSEIVDVLTKAANNKGVLWSQLTSMAGHDAVHMADTSKAAMLFVKSIGGKSHCSDEYTKPEDIEVAGNILLEALLLLDKEL